MRRLIKNLIKILSPELLKIIYEVMEINNISWMKFNKSPWGFSLFENENNKFMSMGEFEKKETEFFRKIIKDFDIFVNVGANVGYYCLHALSFGIETIAVEPNKTNCKLLTKNVDANGFSDSFSLYPVGASSKNGIARLYGSGTASSFIKGWANNANENFSLIPLLSIDQITNTILNKKTLIWIDVEGFEFEVLNGAKEFLSKFPKPIIVIEITTNQHQPKGSKWNSNFLKTFELLWSYGYGVSYITNPKEILEKSMIREAHRNLTPLSCYNFLFTPL